MSSHIFGFKYRNLFNNAAMLTEWREECCKTVGKHTPVASQPQNLLDLSSFIISAIKLEQDFFSGSQNRTECYLVSYSSCWSV